MSEHERDGVFDDEPARDGEPTGGRMRARRWVIAARFKQPADYGIPALPEWTPRCGDGRLAFAAAGSAFISAAEPVPVRR
jgi:hypothetical protein